MERLEIQTRTREEMVDVTARLQALVTAKGWTDGALLVFCPHTTGAVTVNEAADPDVPRDMLAGLARLAPLRGDYHHAEGNSDAHIKCSLIGPDQMLAVEGGSILLGTWQGVYFCEFDGPRDRSLWVKWLGA